VEGLEMALNALNGDMGIDENVNRYGVYKKYVGKGARPNEKWFLEWSFKNKKDAEKKASEISGWEKIGDYKRKVKDHGKAFTYRSYL
tara:strand:- start:3155 stop:3415 length:261 start_codon:yes stop_codon:yes gene_type:complete